MQKVLMNSTIAVVEVPRNKFSGEITEVEQIAEKIGQYGNISKYSIKYDDSKAKITFKLFNPVSKLD